MTTDPALRAHTAQHIVECRECSYEGAAPSAPLDVERKWREWAKNVVRSVSPVHIVNTDAVPTFKRRPDQCIDRAAVLLALEHAVTSDDQ